jgi:prepilin-type processing-associated H-X9-DG protein
MLSPYVEDSIDLFHCPEGFDHDPTSATYGQFFQISYAMSKIIGGPNGAKLATIAAGAGTSRVMLCWEHENTPGCSDVDGLPVEPFTTPYAQPHYPAIRHQGVFQTLFCDGHAQPLAPEDLQLSWFYIQPQ